jgi:hypothetical protein
MIRPATFAARFRAASVKCAYRLVIVGLLCVSSFDNV